MSSSAIVSKRQQSLNIWVMSYLSLLLLKSTCMNLVVLIDCKQHPSEYFSKLFYSVPNIEVCKKCLKFYWFLLLFSSFPNSIQVRHEVCRRLLTKFVPLSFFLYMIRSCLKLSSMWQIWFMWKKWARKLNQVSRKLP